MKGTIGRLQPPALDRPVEDAVLQRLEDRLVNSLGLNRQAGAMVSFMDGVLHCPDVCFSVPAIQRALPRHRRQTNRQLRYLLDGGGWNAAELRVALVAAAVDAGVEAIYLECHEVVRRDAVPFDVITVNLLGQDFCCPVGWLRTFMSGMNPGSMEIAEAERAAAALLLAQLCDDLESVGMDPDFAPLLARDSRYGEMPDLRSDLSGLGFEYMLGLNETFNSGFESPGHPDDPLLAERELVEQLPLRPDGTLPEPRPVPAGPEPAPLGELFTPWWREGQPAFGVARPQVQIKPGELTGYRTINTARELGGLIAEIRPPNAAVGLRLHGLQHGPECGWQAGALLLSVLFAAIQGLLPEGRS